MIRGVTSTRPIAVDDAAQLVALLGRNREFLSPWQPVREPEFFTLDGQREVIKGMLRELERSVTVPHVIVNHDRIVGRVTLSNIVRGPFQSCTIGYWVSADANGQGHATASSTSFSTPTADSTSPADAGHDGVSLSAYSVAATAVARFSEDTPGDIGSATRRSARASN